MPKQIIEIYEAIMYEKIRNRNLKNDYNLKIYMYT